MEKAFQVLYEWENEGIKLKQFSINISMRQIFHHKFIDEVKQLCHQYQQQSPSFQIGSKIIFELTETIAAEDINKLITIMNQLKQLGIKFSMDDFGTGYSSLSYLKRFPVDILKIDQSFIRDVTENSSDAMLIERRTYVSQNSRCIA